MKKLTKILIGAAGMVVAAGAGLGISTAALASNAPEEQPVRDGFIGDQATFTEEYLEARETLAFPPSTARGASDDAAPVLEDGVIAQEGVAAGRANHDWLCAWEGEYLDATAAGDADRATSALDAIQTWETLPWVKEFVNDPERGWYTSVIEPALAGDPSGVEEDHAACG